jgi:ribokinase
MTTILNPAPALQDIDELLPYIDIIAPNQTETAVLTGIDPDCEVQLALAVRALYKKGVRKVVVTMGARGVAVADGQCITYIDARAAAVVDTTGAGDTLIGGMAVQLAKGASLVHACQYGNSAASITVSRVGASISIPYAHEVKM